VRKLKLLFALLSFCFLFTATTCDEDDAFTQTCDERLESLSDLSFAIEELVNASICDSAFECRYIAFGSKPCGGPWEYLIYTTSIDTLELENLVQDYNTIQNEYNLNCDAISDCMAVTPPSSFECIDNTCNPIF